MTTNELKEYLRIVVDMERECYTQERLRSQLVYQIQSLGNRREIAKPTEPDRLEPFISRLCGEFFSILVFGASDFPGQFWSAIGIGIISGFLIYKYSPLGVDSNFIGSYVCGIILGGLIVAILSISGDKAEHEAELKKYEEATKNYEKQMALEDHRVLEEEKEKYFLNQELLKLKASMAQSHTVLQKLYDMNIIFPKYRGFILVSSIYEYLYSGRCTTLEGHEGAYNILENEMRLNNIIMRLDHISAQLNQIKDNQFMIYSAIQESNHTLSKILESNKQISGGIRRLEVQGDELNERVAALQRTSEFNLYFTALNQKELSYMNQMRL